MEYLYHCKGCQKADEEYPLKFDDYEVDEPIYNAPKVEYHMWARNDAYGIYTGLYCDDCYKNNYPYRKDRYHDEAYCGERLEAEDE